MKELHLGMGGKTKHVGSCHFLITAQLRGLGYAHNNQRFTLKTKSCHVPCMFLNSKQTLRVLTTYKVLHWTAKGVKSNEQIVWKLKKFLPTILKQWSRLVKMANRELYLLYFVYLERRLLVFKTAA